MRSDLHLVPVRLKDAKIFTRAHHGALPESPPGHKFSLGVANGDTLVGVAIVGRPCARHYDDGNTLQISRCTTDRTRHAASMLNAAAWRVTSGLGFRRLITYTEHGEDGASLKAAGFRIVAVRPPRAGWSHMSRPRDPGRDSIERTLWEIGALLPTTTSGVA